jgi:CRISPR-associated protein Cas2
MFVVISYDITADRRRNSVADILLEYGTRAQFSVFECYLEPEEMNKLTKRIEGQIDSTTDSVRFYTLCGSCLKSVKVIGTGSVTQDPGFFVI